MRPSWLSRHCPAASNCLAQMRRPPKHNSKSAHSVFWLPKDLTMSGLPSPIVTCMRAQPDPPYSPAGSRTQTFVLIGPPPVWTHLSSGTLATSAPSSSGTAAAHPATEPWVSADDPESGMHKSTHSRIEAK